MNWAALTKKQQQFVMITGFVALLQIIGLFIFIWKRPAESSGSARQELHELQQQIVEAKDIIRRKDIVADALADSRRQLEDLAVFAPTVFDRYAWAYEYISRRAAGAGIEIDGLEERLNFTSTSTANEEGDKPQPYEVSVSTHCSYHALVKFLWSLEENNPLISIKELTINFSEEYPEQHNVRIAVQWPPPFKIEKAGE